MSTLRRWGHEADHAGLLFPPRTPDHVIASFAEARGCLVVTEDRGFIEQAVRRGVALPGVIVFEPEMSTDVQADRLAAALTEAPALLGRALTVGSRRVRNSPLPQPRPIA